MHRFFTKNWEFDPEIKHQIKNVLRLHEGTQIEVCANNECFLGVISYNAKEPVFIKRKQLTQTKVFKVDVVQGLTIPKKCEFSIKHLTLYGVRKLMFVPFLRSEKKLKPLNLNRAETIAKEAAEIAKRFEVPEIKVLSALTDIVFAKYDLVLLADEEAEFDKKFDFKNFKDKNILLIIGPEGGIDISERKYFESLSNCQIVSLGENILTTESAAIGILWALNNL